MNDRRNILMLKKHLLEILSKICDLSTSELLNLDESTELQDLGVTSIKFIELIVEIESQYNIEIRDSDLIIDKFKTIANLFDTVNSYLNEKIITSPKCIILDCDDVLWKGVAGEESIEFDEDILHLHKLLISAYKKGILLCLCTKNSIINISEALSSSASLLSFHHIVAYRANEFDKATNISQIADELNLTLDSFVFLDNSEYEIGYVKSSLPDIECLLVNYDSMAFMQVLESIVDQVEISDFDRTRLYKEQKEREKAKSKFSNIEEYNDSLQTKYDCYPVEIEQIPRIAELSQRTNQFNLSDKHYTTDELLEIVNDPDYFIIGLSASDKYGDMGVIGFAVVNVLTKTIEAFSLSCRVFGRGFENILLSSVKQMVTSGLKGIYRDNLKNRKFANFYKEHYIEYI